MKKTLVVVVLILALCLGVFVGCNNKTCTNHVDANKDGKCDNCGADVTTEVKYSVDITNENSSLYEGKTLQLNVTKEPADAVVNWSTSDATVATVENGVVTALKAGTVTVTATVKEGVSDSVTITVFPYTISIEDVASAEIKAGATLTLTANKQPADAVVSWTSSNNEVATVENGVVTALAKGKTTITASVKDGVSDSIEITVVDPIANAKINTEKFDFSGMYTDAPVIKSNGKQNSFAVLTGDAGKYYVASAVIKVTEPDGGDTWSRVGISHFNGTDSYYGLQLSPGPNFTARKTVTMVIKNDNVQWGTITDRSQV